MENQDIKRFVNAAKINCWDLKNKIQKVMKMNKKIFCLLLGISSMADAGVIKIRNAGQPDAYVPTMDSNNSSNLTVKGLKATTSTLTTVNATTVNATTIANATTVGATTVNATTVNATTISAPGFVPLGGMIAVTPAIDTVNSWQPPATGVIKDGFMRADGNTVPSGQGSPLQGKVLPNMQTANRYPRGSTATSWTTGTYTTGGANSQASNVTVSFGSSSIATSGSHSHTHSADGDLRARFHLTTGDGYNAIYAINGTEQFSSVYARYCSNIASKYSPTCSDQVISESSTPPNVDVSGTTSDANSTGISTTFNQNALSPSVANNTVNNEPAYLEVIWVIRVK
jgi:hypothetical protein